MNSWPLRPRAFADRRCLVTGGLGFIGSNLALALAASGAQVTVVDALVAEHGGDPRNLDGASSPIRVVRSDIGDGETVAPLVADTELIFNLAGQVSHVESMTAPMRDLDLNVRSHLAFLEIVRATNPGAVIVHTSTRQVYGRPRYLPVDEEHPTNPVDVNGIDKLACEQLHLLYAKVHAMRISALRLTNVYGPRQNLRCAGLGFLPVFVAKALRGDRIQVYGDGRQRRDSMHVDDVVRALAAAASCDGAVGEVFNLGHPDARALIDIARATLAAADRDDEVTAIPWPAELAQIDIGSFQGDYSKAKRVLGWEPFVSFADGIADTVAFYRERPWYLSST